MASKNKFYVVWRGRETGIFDSWEACREQIDGFAGAQYKGFPDWQQAHEAHTRGFWQNAIARVERQEAEVERDSVMADAECDGDLRLHYTLRDTATGRLLYRSPLFVDGNYNVGQFLAIVHAVASMQRTSDFRTVYSCSDVAIRWVKNRRCNTSLCRTPANTVLFDTLARANLWLVNNSFANRIERWDKDRWGEMLKEEEE